MRRGYREEMGLTVEPGPIQYVSANWVPAERKRFLFDPAFAYGDRGDG